MREFRPVKGKFGRRYKRRLFIELIVLAFMSYFLIADHTMLIPHWVIISAIAILSISVIFDALFYPKAKYIYNNKSLFIFDNGIGFGSKDKINSIPFTDLRVMEATKDGNDIVSIKLRMKYGSPITIQGYENMTELYEGLTASRENKERHPPKN